jgi:predicted signal transduction protein with EAL and GGDEF domain
MQRLLESGRDRFETRHRRKDGSLWDVEVSIACYRHRGAACLDFCATSACRKQQQAALEQVAHFDALTQLPNRALLTDRLSQKLAHGQRSTRDDRGLHA